VTTLLWVPFHVGEPVRGFAAAATGDVLDEPALEPIAERVADGVRVVVAGDCLAPLAVLAGLQRGRTDPAVVWLDAHGDFNTPSTSPSGYLPGMALAAVVGRTVPGQAEGLALRPVAEERTVLAGARDLDPEESRALAASDVHLAAVSELGPSSVPPGPLLVHVDLDVLDPAAVPAMRYPAPGGATLEDVTGALGRLLATGRVAACSFGATIDEDDPRAPDALAIAARLAEVAVRAGT
jgi:arginase